MYRNIREKDFSFIHVGGLKKGGKWKLPNKIMATVYLHIGTMKTGTSALQRFLDTNREYLKEQGFLYPRLELGLPEQFFFRNGHFVVYYAGRKNLLDQNVDQQEVIKMACRQLGELAENIENIVLSDELIWHYAAKKQDFWTELAESFRKINCDLKIILYLRRQDTFIESLYSHAVKSNHKMAGEFSDYLKGNVVKKFVMDYDSGIKELERQLGRENLLIRIYDQEKYIKNRNLIFADFLEVLGLSLDGNYVMPEKVSNAGLAGNYIEFKRVMNGVPEYRELENFMAGPLVLASSVKTGEKIRRREGFFSGEQRKEFMSLFEEGNRRLAKEYFGREDGVLFEEPEEELAKWHLDEENLWKDILISMTEVICAQEKKIVKLETRWKELAEERENRRINKIYRRVKNILNNESQ